MRFEKSSSAVYQNTVHLVFVVKYRRPALDAAALLVMREITTTSCEEQECRLLEFGGEADHVHMIVSVHPKQSIASLVKILKGRSAKVLRERFYRRLRRYLWGEAFWSPSYCVVSTGGAALDVVAAYVNSQSAPA